jgi:hypothetical protein
MNESRVGGACGPPPPFVAPLASSLRTHYRGDPPRRAGPPPTLGRLTRGDSWLGDQCATLRARGSIRNVVGSGLSSQVWFTATSQVVELTANSARSLARAQFASSGARNRASAHGRCERVCSLAPIRRSEPTAQSPKGENMQERTPHSRAAARRGGSPR